MLLLLIRIFCGTENIWVVFKNFLDAACFWSQQLVFVIFSFSFSGKFFKILFLFFIPIDVFSFLQDSSLNENHQFTEPTFATSWPPILVMCGTDFDARWVPAQLRNGFVWPLQRIPRGCRQFNKVPVQSTFHSQWSTKRTHGHLDVCLQVVQTHQTHVNVHVVLSSASQPQDLLFGSLLAGARCQLVLAQQWRHLTMPESLSKLRALFSLCRDYHWE